MHPWEGKWIKSMEKIFDKEDLEKIPKQERFKHLLALERELPELPKEDSNLFDYRSRKFAHLVMELADEQDLSLNELLRSLEFVKYYAMRCSELSYSESIITKNI